MMQVDSSMADTPWSSAPATGASPSSRLSTLRSAKRPRSPEAPEAQQPSKRPMHIKGQTRRSISGERSTSDWVARTLSLSIKSPDDSPVDDIFSPSRAQQTLSRHSSAMDVDSMMMDSPPKPTITRKLFPVGPTDDIPQLALVIPDRPQTSNAGMSLTSNSDSSQFLRLPEFTSSFFDSSSHNSMPAMSDSLLVPRINVQPATPESLSRATSLAPPSPLVPSPINPVWSHGIGSGSMSWSPASPSKRRVSMGPRADCDKCRLGVKGHWMHYD